ncbi:MAG: RNA pseudouridine synthase [Bacteroidetes bacterium]|nr:MAG: RNA pseudouridine synthase [Bacteroidota bacterium]PTM14615.1 MAG: RNA pseudouridine synthase [Bacteroidota bacterium]
MLVSAPCLRSFRVSVADWPLPERFTFPFYYDPHPLSQLAAEELQQELATQTTWDHNFGLPTERPTDGLVIGKMFGVLVVQDEAGELGYLAAFSGKLAESNHHAGFVPPVFDMLTEGSFFNQGMMVLNPLNSRIKALEEAPALRECQELATTETALCEQELANLRQLLKTGKQARKVRRQAGEAILDATELAALKDTLMWESQRERMDTKQLTRYWKTRQAEAEARLATYRDEIATLKKDRKAYSANLQQQLFDAYQFLDQQGARKSLLSIFQDIPPPAGAGECAAPKLLQYAFLHGLKPIALAEFWWGQSPKSEVRKHRQYYPACRGKCEPILSHMLQGIDMDVNPMKINMAEGKTIDYLYEDDLVVVINKPAEFLSVPGRNVQDSVQLRVKAKYPDATGPLVVHRLDMSTSGLMLLAKTQEAYKILQSQFIRRTIQKRYVALLEGGVVGDQGTIDLPLRVDLDDRPRQLVCYEHGKKAHTEWQVVERAHGQTRIHFFPHTGRTHQLRVHAAHPLGLNTPIIGDDLYGNKHDRLCLHAESLTFRHPATKEWMTFQLDAPF